MLRSPTYLDEASCSLKELVKKHILDNEPLDIKAVLDITLYFKKSDVQRVENQIDLDIFNDFIRFIKTGHVGRHPVQLFDFYIDKSHGHHFDPKEDEIQPFYDSSDKTNWPYMTLSFVTYDRMQADKATDLCRKRLLETLGVDRGGLDLVLESLPIKDTSHVRYMLETMYVTNYDALSVDNRDK